ncbi:MAG: hypothetical protein ABWX93_07795 [Pseudoxanthomonas sp.]
MAKARTVVFVQGGKKNEADFPWMFFHLDPDKEAAPESVCLVFFDYPNAKLKIWKNILLKRGSAPTAAPDSETVLLPWVKMRNADGTLGGERPSITLMYDWVKRQPKQSIRSLQVFSHGWMGGPIVWNSAEYDPAGKKLEPLDQKPRDPNDTDFRIRDFFGSNPLAGAEGRKFADAFASDALIKLWGCVAPDGIRQQMQNYLKAPKGSSGDAARKAHLADYLGSIGDSFPMVMASELNLAVWAAPIGYGSEPGPVVPVTGGEKKVVYRGTFPPDLGKDRWWRVSWFFRNQDRGARFYTDVLKARIDAVDFVEHRKAWFDDARRVATARVEKGPFDSPRDLQRRLTDRIEAMRVG